MRSLLVAGTTLKRSAFLISAQSSIRPTFAVSSCSADFLLLSRIYLRRTRPSIMAISLSTEDKLEYQFYPVAHGQVQFRVKAANDAHVALTTGPQETDPMYEVFIGGWGNAKSVIRRNRTKPDVAEVETPDILTADEYRGFWVRWQDNLLSVGKEGESEPFLQYHELEPIGIGYFGVCTGWGATGEWLIEAPTAPPAPTLGDACWCDASGGVVPPGAVEGGIDGGEPLYVARAQHMQDLIPGKLKPSHSVCYVSWGGDEHPKGEYQVLCGCSPTWMPCSDGNIPPNALPGGETESGETLYIGRVNHEDSLTIGKVHPTYNSLFIPYGGKEVAFTEYEILVQ